MRSPAHTSRFQIERAHSFIVRSKSHKTPYSFPEPRVKPRSIYFNTLLPESLTPKINSQNSILVDSNYNADCSAANFSVGFPLPVLRLQPSTHITLTPFGNVMITDDYDSHSSKQVEDVDDTLIKEESC